MSKTDKQLIDEYLKTNEIKRFPAKEELPKQTRRRAPIPTNQRDRSKVSNHFQPQCTNSRDYGYTYSSAKGS